MRLLFKCVPDERLVDWVRQTNRKLKESDMVKNPYYGTIKLSKDKGQASVLIEMSPIYPDFSYWAIVPLGMMLFFDTPLWAYVFLLPFVASYILHTTTFYQVIIYRSLRKHGYRGKLKWASPPPL